MTPTCLFPSERLSVQDTLLRGTPGPVLLLSTSADTRGWAWSPPAGKRAACSEPRHTPACPHCEPTHQDGCWCRITGVCPQRRPLVSGGLATPCASLGPFHAPGLTVHACGFQTLSHGSSAVDEGRVRGGALVGVTAVALDAIG